MSPLVLLAPAKLNLGLAIVGKRSDGFHDLVTIFQTVSIFDTLTVTSDVRHFGPGPTRLTCSHPALEGSDNLVVRTVELVRAKTGRTDPVAIRLEKEIPSASGLGGASSDAATMLRCLDDMWNLHFSPAELNDLALSLGSDVPFFLSGGCAIGWGRGENLRPLSPRQLLWYVVVVPALSAPIPRKTASLFAALESSDYRDGSDVIAQAARIDAGDAIDQQLLGNSFARPLYRLRPELSQVRDKLLAAGAPFVAVSGAGPAHYAVVPTREEADRIMARFRSLYSGESATFVCRNTPARDAAGV